LLLKINDGSLDDFIFLFAISVKQVLNAKLNWAVVMVLNLQLHKNKTLFEKLNTDCSGKNQHTLCNQWQYLATGGGG
jgi:hypothetical protein